MTRTSDRPAGPPAVPGLPAGPDVEAAGLGGLPAVWLRDQCRCPGCRDPHSGQRLTSITDQPEHVWIAAVSTSEGSVTVAFGPDGHVGVYARSWLADQQAVPPDPRGEDAKIIWTAADLGGQISPASWPCYLASQTYRAQCLDAILRTGFVLLRDVPAEPGAVLDVAESMGFVRETNYGRLFDVRAQATPANLALTGLPIAPHTDNPYRDPVPTVQLLHCLVTAAAGGDSGLLDGFAAARLLREENPAAFAVLTGTPVTFAYTDARAELTASRPMISVDPRGAIREIRVNNRSMQPLQPAPGDRPADAAERAVAFYAAYRAFAEILARPELTLTFRLGPGDCVVFDNTRILHARSGFAAAGHRHVQGCYIDLDGVASSLALLRRQGASGDDQYRGADRARRIDGGPAGEGERQDGS
ncbi:MAG: TauD/TfdA family dioxygenase [Streptosporangiaceae bacterium]